MTYDSRNRTMPVISYQSLVISSRKGIATLPTIMALTILILAVGVGITSLSLTELFISAGQTQSSQAFFYAEAGARDALERIARDKNFSTTTYQIAFVTSGCTTNDGCATITVSSGAGSVADPKIVTSKGQVKSNVRRVQIDVVFDDSLHGEMATTTWQELTN